MAEADWVKTAKFGLKLSFAAFLLPFLFAYDTRLLLIGTPGAIFLSVIRAALALLLISAGFMGYWKAECTLPKRFLLIVAGGLLCIPNMWTALAGIVIGILLWHFSDEPEQIGYGNRSQT